MNTLQTRLGIKALLIAGLVSFLAGCGTSQQLPPGLSSTPPGAAAPMPAQNQQANAVPSAMRARPSQEVSPKLNSGIVLTQIHETDMTEIALGKMAEEKASSDEVRAYADQLIKDHSNVDEMIVAKAPKSGIDLQNGAAAHRALREATAREKFEERKLQSAKGPEFDRLFLRQASLDNERLISKLKQDREDASSDEVEVTIDNTIPILEQHRKLAQILMKKEQAQAQASRTHG